MKLKKQLWALARLALPALGFALTSSGAYLVSLENPKPHSLAVVPAYATIVLGFLVTLGGVFWSVCHSMKSKMYQRGAPQQRVFTVDRPSSFPPSYAESQLSQCSWLPPAQQTPPPEVMLGADLTALAPPLYSQDGSVAPDCSWSWEPPPQYSQEEPSRDASPAR